MLSVTGFLRREGGGVTAYVRYVPEDRELDLSALTADDYKLITGLHGAIRHGDPVLLCREPGAGDGEMHIRDQGRGRYIAAHFPGGAHGSHPISLESAEHQRQKEYWARSAQAAGLRATIEYTVPGGRLDVAITGGAVATDIEIQRSEITARTAKVRTSKYFKAGFLPVWFNDGSARPLWLNEVPALGCVRMPWNEQLPRPRAVTATGLTTFEAVRCVIGAFDRCPDNHPRPCGRFHARPSPWGGLAVDDVAAMIPAGEILPMRGPKGLVYLVSPASLARYQELNRGQGKWLPGGGPKTVRRSKGSLQHAATCRNPQHDHSCCDRSAAFAGRDSFHRPGDDEPRGPGVFLAGLCGTCGRVTVDRNPAGSPQHADCQ
jgi:hypothetical protein